jgi:uncharacterized protein YqgC (DUF456 family)
MRPTGPFGAAPAGRKLEGTMETLLWTCAVVFVLAGLAGTLLPVLPGVPLVFAGLLAAAWADGFQHVGWPVLLVLGVLTAAAFVVDIAASGIGARRAGATRAATLGAGLGALVGVFFGLPGLLLGPFVGAAVGQFAARGDVSEAGRVGFGAWLGFLVGTAAKLALAVLMVLVFGVAWLL